MTLPYNLRRLYNERKIQETACYAVYSSTVHDRCGGVTYAATSGELGDHITWEQNEGDIVIKGNGRMSDHLYDSQMPLWKADSSPDTVVLGSRLIYKYTLHFANNNQILDLAEGLAKCPFSYRTFSGDITIPDFVDSIGNEAFRGDFSISNFERNPSTTSVSLRSMIESITFNDRLETIGDYCFAASDIVNELEFGSNLKTIGKGAFWNTKITGNLSIPANVESIGEAAFMDTECLSGNLIIADKSKLTEISKNLFRQSSISGEVRLPEGIRKIDHGAFEGCVDITGVRIPITVTDINSYAFKDCPDLTSVYYEGNAKSWKKIGGAGAEVLKDITPSFGNKLQVSFDFQNDKEGDERYQHKIVESGAKVEKPADPEKEGYVFDGWYTDLTYSREWDFEKDTVTDENIDLVAKWITLEEKEQQEKEQQEKVITVSDNKPMNVYTENIGGYQITYPHEIPFPGKSKITVDNFGREIIVSQNNITYNVTKIKVNKKTRRIQITGLGGADKAIVKALKKATKGGSGLPFSMNPYYVRDTDNVITKPSKGGGFKSVKIVIGGKNYKAKTNEWEYSEGTKIITFKGSNLDGSYTVK